jgi:multidrug efflux system membrane fusion protein
LNRTEIYTTLIASALVLSGCQKQAAQPKGAGMMPVFPVSVAKAARQSVPTELRVVGTVEASAVVQVKSQIAGQLVGVEFAEGQNVAEGDLLFRIDARPYEDALRQAEAAVARDRAQILQAEASLARDDAQAKFAASDAERQAELNRGGLTPRSQFDQAQSTAEAAKASARATQASIETAKAALAADEAAVAKARLDLSHCEIRAPLSGRTGNLLVNAGNLVKESDVPLVVIHRVSPIFVGFNAPEQYLSAIRRLNAASRLAVRAFAESDPSHTAIGTLAVIDNTVDTTTGTIHLKATFDNRDGLLWPGQFVSTVLTLDTIRDAVVVPSEAVQSGQQGSFVYALKPDSSVEMRPVTPGRVFGAQTVIDKGVAAGDTVVTDGFLVLFPGARVRAAAAAGAGSGAE